MLPLLVSFAAAAPPCLQLGPDRLALFEAALHERGLPADLLHARPSDAPRPGTRYRTGVDANGDSFALLIYDLDAPPASAQFAFHAARLPALLTARFFPHAAICFRASVQGFLLFCQRRPFSPLGAVLPRLSHDALAALTAHLASLFRRLERNDAVFTGGALPLLLDQRGQLVLDPRSVAGLYRTEDPAHPAPHF